MSSSSIVLGLCVLGATAFFLLGFVGYRVVLNANKCQMTYSRPARYPVLFNVSEWNYSLRKISHFNNNKLNPRPVLFIPGHSGNHDQSRSFASDIPDMHNEDNDFQYFALDFDEAPMAFHAGYVLEQAAFANEALKFIRNLYAETHDDSPNVMILAHSYGGMIARTSMLLSNHPKCIVDTIVSLSAPFVRAPYCPDSSLDQLFTQVNKAWFTASYNSSDECRQFHALESTKTISLNHICPNKCVGNTRIINFSGGDVDVMVPSDVTDVFQFSARPRNATLIVPKTNVYTLEKYFQIKALLKSIFAPSVAKILDIAHYFTGKTSPSTVDSAIETKEDQNATEPVLTNGSFAYITRSLWEETILPFADPQHFVVRTSQLKRVKVPIDHFATLWCHQFLQVVHDSMLKLSRVPVGQIVDWKSIVPLSFSHNEVLREAVDEVKILGIPNLESFVTRNASHQKFLSDSEIDAKFITGILVNPVWTSAMYFWVRNLGKIFTCTVAMLIFSISNELLRNLMGLSHSKSWFSRIIDVDAYIRLANRIGKLARRNFSEFSIFASILVAVVVGYLARNDMLTKANLLHVLDTTLCVFVGMGMSVLVQQTVELMSILLSGLVWPLRAVVDWICDVLFSPVLNFLRNKIPPVASAVQLMLNHLADMIALSLLLTILYVASSKPQFGSLGRANIVFSAFILCFYLLDALLLFVVVAWKRKEKSVGKVFLTLHLIALALGTPSSLFAFKQLLGSSPANINLAELTQIFGPDRINSCLTLFLLFLHLKLAVSTDFFNTAPAMEFFKNMMKTSKHVVNKHCYHEDGGPRAVFVEIDVSSTIVVEQVQLIRGNEIVIGPTFKVVSCDCPSDRTLKSFEEWCEFCKCENCGGKGHIATRGASDTPTVTINLDFALWFSLTLVSGYLVIFGSDQLFFNFFAAGIVACLFVARNFFTRNAITIGV